MKITIDTKEDTIEEIKNAIKMLSSLVGEKSYTNQPNIFENSSPEVSPGSPPEISHPTQQNVFGNIFEDTQPETKPAEETQTISTEEPEIEEKEEVKDSSSVTEYY